MLNPAFIIGNGASRKQFGKSGIELLSDHGTVFGCNALYREWKPEFNLPHFLVSFDDEILKEVHESGFPKHRIITPKFADQYEDVEYNFHQLRMNAGMYAMKVAIEMGYTKLICLGFDFLIDDPVSTQNVYQGTNAYGPESVIEREDCIRRMKYLEYFTGKHENISFQFVLPNEVSQIRMFEKPRANVSGTTYRYLEEKIYTLNLK